MKRNSFSSIFQNAITRLLTVCVAEKDRLCGIRHKLANVHSGPNSSRAKERVQPCALSVPEETTDGGRKERKHWIHWHGPWGAYSSLQLYTSAEGEHKKKNTTQQSSRVCAFLQDTNTGGGCDHELQKQSTSAAWIIETNRKWHKYFNAFLPSSRSLLLTQHLFSLQKHGA